jgi:hypothetical protein
MTGHPLGGPSQVREHESRVDSAIDIEPLDNRVHSSGWQINGGQRPDLLVIPVSRALLLQ